MTPAEVKAYYGSQYGFQVETKMSAGTLGNWLRWGYVPENAQYKLERMTGGRLKANMDDIKITVPLAEKFLEKADKDTLSILIKLHNWVSQKKIRIGLPIQGKGMFYVFPDKSMITWDGETIDCVL